jgi:hypothetical protein
MLTVTADLTSVNASHGTSLVRAAWNVRMTFIRMEIGKLQHNKYKNCYKWEQNCQIKIRHC